MADAFLAVLVLFLGVGGSLVLYLLVRSETRDRAVMDREDAERVARRDHDDGTTDRP